jgi:hypothetical protein
MVPSKRGGKCNEVYPHRELLEGEELLASYIDPLLMRAERQQLLQVRYTHNPVTGRPKFYPPKRKN